MSKEKTLAHEGDRIFNTGDRLFELFEPKENEIAGVERLLYNAGNGYNIEIINETKTEITFKESWIGIDPDAEMNVP